MSKEKRTIKLNGIQLGFKPTESLIELIDDKIKSIKVKTNDMFDKDLVKKNSLLNTKKTFNQLFISMGKYPFRR